MRYLISTAIILIFSLSLDGQNKPIHQDSFQNIITKFQEEHEFPGLVASVFTSSQILNIDASGIKKLGSNDPVKIHDRFHIGSNTKAMTGFVAAALVERELINWDTKFLDLFPEFQSSSHPGYRDITLQMLLSHTAGIQAYTDSDEFEVVPITTDSTFVEDRLAWCASLLKQAPDTSYTKTGYRYSNAGYSIATAMLEKVSGLNYEQLMDKYLFQPLGMDGHFSWPNHQDSSQPWGHFQDEENDSIMTFLPEDDEYTIGRILAPAGDVNLSMPDYIRFIQANMKGLGGENNVISSQSYQHLHYSNFPEIQYGIGWGVAKVALDEDTNILLSTHDGSGGTYYCHFIMFPEIDLGICIMTNSATESQERNINKLRNKLFKPYLPSKS